MLIELRPIWLATVLVVAHCLASSAALAQGADDPAERSASGPPSADETIDNIDRPDGPGESAEVDNPFLAALGDTERQLTLRAAEELGLTVTDDAYGRCVDEVYVRTYDVFLPEDPFPQFLNVLHATTRDEVVRAAIVLQPGSTFTETALKDSRRELYDEEIYAQLAIVPVESEDGECVDVLVMGRDLLSLRLTLFYEGTGLPLLPGSVVDRLTLIVQDSNIFGSNGRLGLGFFLEPGEWRLGPIYDQRRFLQSRIDVSERFFLRFDRLNGELMGSQNATLIELPIYATDVEWGWSLFAGHSTGIERRFVGQEQRTWDDPSTPDQEAVPEQWRQTDVNVEGSVTRSFGAAWKENITVGAMLDLQETELLDEQLELSETLQSGFLAARVPRTERLMGPFLGVSIFENRYLYLTNYNRYGVSEEIGVGFYSRFLGRLSEPNVGADKRIALGEAEAEYVLPINADGFARAGAFATARRTAQDWEDVRVRAEMGLVTPLALAGRLVATGSVRRTWNDRSNERIELGSETGLRGFPTGFRVTQNVGRANVAWRSVALDLWSVRLGGVVFSDSAFLFDDDEPDEFLSAAGAGVRILVPQIMTTIISLYVAVPVAGDNVGEPLVTFTTGIPFCADSRSRGCQLDEEDLLD